MTYYSATAVALLSGYVLDRILAGRAHLRWAAAVGAVCFVFAPNVWHALRVEFAGARIRVVFDGKTYIDLEDAHIAGGMGETQARRSGLLHDATRKPSTLEGEGLGGGRAACSGTGGEIHGARRHASAPFPSLKGGIIPLT